MNINVTDSNDSIGNGEHDGLTTVTNSEEDELNRNKIYISKDFLVTKDQKKNKDNELNPLFSKLFEQVKEFSNDKIQLMFIMKAQELHLKFKSGKKLKDVNTLKDIGKSLYTDKSQENKSNINYCLKGQFETQGDRFGWAQELEKEFMDDYNYVYLEDDKVKMKGCIERLIVRRRIELSKLVKRLGEPLEDTKRNDIDDNQSSCYELVEKNREIAELRKLLAETKRNEVSLLWLIYIVKDKKY